MSYFVGIARFPVQIHFESAFFNFALVAETIIFDNF